MYINRVELEQQRRWDGSFRDTAAGAGQGRRGGGGGSAAPPAGCARAPLRAGRAAAPALPPPRSAEPCGAALPPAPHGDGAGEGNIHPSRSCRAAGRARRAAGKAAPPRRGRQGALRARAPPPQGPGPGPSPCGPSAHLLRINYCPHKPGDAHTERHAPLRAPPPSSLQKTALSRWKQPENGGTTMQLSGLHPQR